MVTEKKSINIKKEWLDKLEEEQFAMNRQYNALAFDFGGGCKNQQKFYIINEQTFKQMLEVLKNE